MRWLLACALAVALGGCWFAPDPPPDETAGDGGIDAVFDDSAASRCFTATDKRGPITTVPAANGLGDDVYIAGFHDDIAVVWQLVAPVSKFDCWHAMYPLASDHSIQGFDAITAGVTIGTSSSMHVLVTARYGTANVEIHDLRALSSGELVASGRASASGGAATPIGTTSGTDHPAFITINSTASRIWFGGGQSLATTTLPLGPGPIDQVDVSASSTDKWYAAVALDATSVILVGQRGDSRATLVDNMATLADIGSRFCSLSACSARLTQPLRHPVPNLVPAEVTLGFSLRLGGAVDGNLDVLTRTDDNTPGRSPFTIGSADRPIIHATAAELDQPASGVGAVLFVLGPAASSGAELDAFRVEPVTPPNDPATTPVSGAPTRLVAVHVGDQRRVIVLDDNAAIPSQCFALNALGTAFSTCPD